MKIWLNLKNTLVTTFLTLLGVSLLLFFLYQYDNKYTQNSKQPVNGSLYLTQNYLEKNQTLFLTEGWAFYPDKLLTPGDFKNQTPDAFMQYMTIGKYNDFSLGKNWRSPVGSATYSLLLHLPETPTSYSIALPEIFSAYSFYVNDTLYAQLGNPKPEEYRDSIGKRVLSFEGSGKVSLLLAVRNESHFYSGLTYPPLFGLSQAVQQELFIKLIISTTSIALLLGCAGLFLYFAIRIRDKRPGIFVLICLCTTGYTLYPLLFSVFTLPVQPWYSFELLCLYGIYFLAVLLQNKLCQVSKKRTQIMGILLIIFCGMAFLYTFPLIHLWLPHFVFVTLSRTVKYFVAFYLLITSFKATLQRKSKFNPLLIGTAAFAITIIYDRLFPFYEPIYGGWFPEYGGLFLVFGFGCVLWKEMAEAYRFQMAFSEEKRQLIQQVSIQKTHYQALVEKIDEATRIRHDERHHFRILHSFLDKNAIEHAKKYLETQEIESEKLERIVLCNNMIIDAISKYYQTLCRKQKITFSIMAELPHELPISDTDLSILFGNLVENAYEACTRQVTPEPFIRIIGKYHQNRLMLRVENSYDTPVTMKNDQYLSVKHNGIGIGTASVRQIVKNYSGLVTFKDNRPFFQASVLINFTKHS